MRPQIYWIEFSGPGRLAILARPRGTDWLEEEVRGWKDAGIDVVVSCLTESENRELGLVQEADEAHKIDLVFISFPIVDYSVPASHEETMRLVATLESFLLAGKSVGIHCRQGIGRSSVIAACVLRTSGESANESFSRIATARGLTVPDTVEQRQWVSAYGGSLN